MNKNYRQGQILKLIRAKEIFTQDELATELKSQGILATQVTLSRDLRDLHLIKTPNGYQQLNSAEEEAPSQAFNFLRDVRLAQNQVVLKTDPGHASIVAVALDNEDWPEVAGTIAGDDTVLVIAVDSAAAALIRQRLLDLM